MSSALTFSAKNQLSKFWEVELGRANFNELILRIESYQPLANAINAFNQSGGKYSSFHQTNYSPYENTIRIDQVMFDIDQLPSLMHELTHAVGKY
ncbi:hypothetical protein [Paralysiella testudinis]|uniref:Uncharacterized protein n=1 Tax=Paralysiella testudinis TaxID=2809020 RepID=A0A892ZIA3_9NEIS|nr:hypothetical protein [Paralysiella testudinis]QRQ80659.1 hypothetical protein JQU52_07715 [Paralysiella testudinis]